MNIGIIGAGQLGRMMALSGYPLGLKFTVVDPNADSSGAQVAQCIQGAYDDAAALRKLAAACDVITFDVENVPVSAVEPIAQLKPFYPPVNALAASQDRLIEKTLFRELGIPTPEFRAVDSLADLQQAVKEIGLPGILKTRRLGYDGKGQFRLKKSSDVETAWQTLSVQGIGLIYEAFVPFTREVSIIGARNTKGETAIYPLATNTHLHGVLHYSVAPYRHASLQRLAENYLKRLFKQFNYVGVLTIEFFVLNGKLLANEMAPRVHNSGHWTIEGAETSQFENHIRAICGLPLGSTAPRAHAAMVNFVGAIPERDQMLKMQLAHFHHYGKETRPGRKLGHATVVAPTAAKRDQLLKKLLKFSKWR
ncbi:MAG TPA: 5-(carboxyamino)imidazole ribonucleotide synthase [Steroidobacteraceae bacterium]|nr:5-(carboxyamino)imidazole ribonucleotide synthase [Steroidobacteraceae bacterium]